MTPDEITQQIETAWRDHGYTILIAALGAVALTLLLTLWRARRRGKTERWVATVAGIAVLGLSAEGMWVVARERLGLSVGLAAVVFFVFEATMVSAAMLASAQYNRTTVRDEDGSIVTPGHPGPSGTTVWLIAGLAGGVVSLNSKSVVEFVLRLVLPLMAALMWWNTLTAEGTSRPQGSWRWTPRRLLVAIGAVEPTERNLAQVDRDRRIATMTITAQRVHSGSWPHSWHRARLLRHALRADDAMMRAVQERVSRAHAAVALTAPPTLAAAPTAPPTHADRAPNADREAAPTAPNPAPKVRAEPAPQAAPRRGSQRDVAWAWYTERREAGADTGTPELVRQLARHVGCSDGQARKLRSFCEQRWETENPHLRVVAPAAAD